MRLKTGINCKSLVRIPGPYSHLSYQVIQRTRGTHYRKEEIYSLDKVKGEASGETKEGQLKGKEHWLVRKDIGSLSTNIIPHWLHVFA